MPAALAAFFAVGLIGLAPARTDDAKKDADAMQGTWRVVKIMVDGKQEPQVEKDFLIIITEGTIRVEIGGEKRPTSQYKLDPGKNPKHIDMKSDQGVIAGIYEIKGEVLRICLREKGDRPASFDATGNEVLYFESKRDK